MAPIKNKQASFIRLLEKDKEVLINVHAIWKIEVRYALPKKDGQGYHSCSMDEAADNPEAIRFFHIFTGPGQTCIKNDPDDPVCRAPSTRSTEIQSRGDSTKICVICGQIYLLITKMARSALRLGSSMTSVPASVSRAMRRWMWMCLSRQKSSKSAMVKKRMFGRVVPFVAQQAVRLRGAAFLGQHAAAACGSRSSGS